MIVHEENPQVAAEDQSAPICCHYWIIETAHGPISRGECQICHEVRDFKNSVFDMDRDSQDSRSRKGSNAEANEPQAATPVAGEISPELGVDELESEEEETPDSGPELGPETESEVEEPEFAGVSKD